MRILFLLLCYSALPTLLISPSLFLLISADASNSNGEDWLGLEGPFYHKSYAGEWQEGEVEFEGRRTRRGASEQILEDDEESLLTIKSQTTKLKIRLHRSTSPPFTFKLREGPKVTTLDAASISSCHWKGQVTGGGVAALSSCQHPNSFSGVVMTDEGAWLVEPVPGRIRRSTRDISGNGVPHLMLPPHATATHLKRFSNISDGVRVPLAELEEAARLAAQEALERQLIRQTALPLTFQIGGQQGGSWRHTNLLARTSRTPTTSKKKWVEMALFTDESLYRRMEKTFPNDTALKLKDYVSTMINTMDLLYGQKSLGVDIGFRLVHLEVMKSVPAQLNSNGGKAKAYLSSFCEYAGGQNVNSALWDHALLLTGIDLHEEGLKSTAGLAWAGTMCYRYYSCSVAEGYTFGSAFIITHEIGHSLGMEHDGAGVSQGCDTDKFIMSPTTGPGKINWSNCSGKNLKDFIDYGTSELRAKKEGAILSQPTCLTEILVPTKETGPGETPLPGQNYDAYFQCALGLGSQFKPYFQRNKAPFNNICWILYCGNGTHAVSTHPALEGTKCDKNKYCRGGECVSRV